MIAENLDLDVSILELKLLRRRLKVDRVAQQEGDPCTFFLTRFDLLDVLDLNYIPSALTRVTTLDPHEVQRSLDGQDLVWWAWGEGE